MMQTNRYGVVYLVTNNVNGKRYVGITTTTVEVRWYRHVTAARSGGPGALAAALRKYGEAAFSVELLTEADGKELLFWLEQEFIKELGTKQPKGYNLTDGGEGVLGYSKTPEQRARMSEIIKKRVITDEHRARLSEGGLRRWERWRAEGIPRNLSDESRRRMSEAAKASWARRKAPRGSRIDVD